MNIHVEISQVSFVEIYFIEYRPMSYPCHKLECLNCPKTLLLEAPIAVQG